MPYTTQETYKATSEALILGELCRILQEMLENDPDISTIPVYHVEFGGMERSTTVELLEDEDGEQSVVVT